MLPKAVGVCSNLGLSRDTLGNGERSMERDRVWLGLSSVGVIGGHNAVG